MTDKPQKAAPKGAVARSAVVGAAAVKAGAKKAASLSTRPFLSPEKREQAAAQNDEAIAAIIFDALSKLRGCALKAAQVLAMETDFLPKPYLDELAKSASEVPPMNRALLNKVIRTELKADPSSLFASFDQTPFAAASLGQVHAATDFDGREWAVKVQYPGMASSVSADVKLLKGVLFPTRYRHIFAHCFSVIEAQVLEELDYTIEVGHAKYFASVVDSKRFCVPKIHDAFSTQRVLTSSFVKGKHLAQFLEGNPTQQEKDHFGQLLVDFFHDAAFTHRLIHADPNPGNFLFCEDGRLGVIDFGCCTPLIPSFVDALPGLLGGDSLLNAADVEASHARLGVHYRHASDDAAFQKFFKKWVAWLKIPYQTTLFDFGENKDYFEKGRGFQRELMQYIDHYDGGFIYYGRTSHGIMRILQQLGARVNMMP